MLPPSYTLHSAPVLLYVWACCVWRCHGCLETDRRSSQNPCLLKMSATSATPPRLQKRKLLEKYRLEWKEENIYPWLHNVCNKLQLLHILVFSFLFTRRTGCRLTIITCVSKCFYKHHLLYFSSSSSSTFDRGTITLYFIFILLCIKVRKMQRNGPNKTNLKCSQVWRQTLKSLSSSL